MTPYRSTKSNTFSIQALQIFVNEISSPYLHHTNICTVKGKGKVIPITGLCGTDGG